MVEDVDVGMLDVECWRRDGQMAEKLKLELTSALG